MSTRRATVITTPPPPMTANVGATSPQAKLQAIDLNAPKDKGQKDKLTRHLVHHYHVSKLVCDYWVHFGNHGKGRKKASKQLILKKVWDMVYKDYMQKFPTSLFKENTLKDHL